MEQIINKIVVVGNVTRDPEFKTIRENLTLCKFGVAVNVREKNPETGNYEEEVCFINVDAWGTVAEGLEDLKKGGKVLVEGKLKFSSWTDKDGREITTHSITASIVNIL